MNRCLFLLLLVAASLPVAASQREPVKVRVGDGTGVTVRVAGKCSNDAQCNDGVFCNGQERCRPTDGNADARGCVAGAPPCADYSEQCLEAEDRCRVGPCDVPDADGDGHAAIACGGDDCDDYDANRSPGLTEICDAEGNDEDCDVTTVGFRDADRDGYIDAACL